MADNPFESPYVSDASVPSRPIGGSRSVEDARFTPVMEMYILGMRPWVKFMGVVGMILAVLVALVAVLAAVGGMLTAAGGNPSGIVMAVMSLAYLIFAAIYAYPAWQLLQSSSRIQTAMLADDGEGRELGLEEFFRHQQNLWRFMGILTLVVVCLYGLLILVVCTGSLAGTMSQGNF